MRFLMISALVLVLLINFCFGVNMRKILAFSMEYLAMYKILLSLYIGVSVASNTAVIALPYITGNFIDKLIEAIDMYFFYDYFIKFVSINLTILLLGYVGGRVFAYLQTKICFTMNKRVIEHLQLAPLRLTENEDAAYLNQRINQDSNSVVVFCLTIIQNIIINSFLVIAPLFLLFSLSGTISFMLLFVSAMYLCIYFLYKSPLRKSNFALVEAQSKFFSKLNEQVMNIKAIKMHGLAVDYTSKLSKGFKVFLSCVMHYQRTSYIFSSFDRIVMILAQGIMLFLGGREIVLGRMTIGQFTIMSSYFGMMLNAIRAFFSFGQNVQEASVSFQRLHEILSVPIEANGTLILPRVDRIDIANINFSRNDKYILKNINAHFAKGNIYIIKGENGTGKSTFVNIILGLHNNEISGTVSYNGIPIDDIDMHKLRKTLIGVVEQEPTLLPDTHVANVESEYDAHNGVYYGLLESRDLIKSFSVERFFEKNCGELNKSTCFATSNMSGGEKQKVALIKSFIKKPDVLILDEPTSALDDASISALRQYLNELRNNKIIILITHVMDFVDENDIILNLSDGEFVT